MNAGVGVEGVDAGVLCGYVEDVALLAADHHVGEVERLSIDFAVDCIEADLAELSGVYVALRKDGLLWVESVASDVVVKGGYIGHVGYWRGLYGQGEGRGVSQSCRRSL